MKNIILTGFMGTGKTTIGRLLAARTGRTFVDTDELIAQRSGKAIAEIFSEEGSQAFRGMERDMAVHLAPLQGLIIASGGRLMLDEDNSAALSADSLVICLQAEPDEILQRVTADGVRRPLLEVPEPARRVAELLEERAEGYGQFPQVTTGARGPAEVVDEIIATFGLERNAAVSAPTRRLIVTHPQGAYEVIVGQGLLTQLPKLALIGQGDLAVISDSHVGPLFGAHVEGASFQALFAAGEANKTLDTVCDLYERLLEAGLDRSGTVLALGGGVVGDVAGFVAATYMRGVRLVQCPTSLLAMVDASVGGKTGVDLPQGKNLVGAFKQPVAVLADVDTLRTLPPAEFAAGMAEVVKHALLSGGDLLTLLENGDWRQETLFQPGKEGALQDLVAAAIEVKRNVVEEDPYEQGRRALLNLGHTFAHAIERVSCYGIRHGYAVAMGLVAAVRLSERLGHCEASLQTRVEDLLKRFYLPTRIPSNLAAQNLLDAMQRDKKKVRGQLRFILIRDIGEPFISSNVARHDALQAIQEVQEA